MNGKIEKSFDNLKRPMHLSFNMGNICFSEFLNDSLKVIENDSVKGITLNEKPDAPASIDLAENNLFVADFFNNRILIYNLEGKLLNILKDHFDHPSDILFNGNYLWVPNYAAGSITVYRKK